MSPKLANEHMKQKQQHATDQLTAHKTIAKLQEKRFKLQQKKSQGCGVFNIKRSFMQRKKMERDSIANLIEKKREQQMAGKYEMLMNTHKSYL